MALPLDYARLLPRFYRPFAAWLMMAREQQSGPLLAGICGAQGSGKSTVARLVAQLLETEYTLRTLVLSLDDFYLTRKRRLQLAATVHPLFQARGVPGTHDTRLGMATLRAVIHQSPDELLTLPLFDKALDDRCPTAFWPGYRGRPDIVLFEGWCVGAQPQTPEQLRLPINTLEKELDPTAVWRRLVNEQLAGPYQQWFTMLNKLVLLQIPDFSLVQQWRGLQEQKLSSISMNPTNNNVLDDQALQRFIQHYERLTRHILREMPHRADLVIPVDQEHNPAWPEVRP